VGSALVEVTDDVMSVANAKVIEAANKSVQSIRRRCRSRANRALISRPWNRAIILFDSFEACLATPVPSGRTPMKTGFPRWNRNATKKSLPTQPWQVGKKCLLERSSTRGCHEANTARHTSARHATGTNLCKLPHLQFDRARSPPPGQGETPRDLSAARGFWGGERETGRDDYCWSSRRTLLGMALAWANMAVPDWTRMFAFAYCVLSSATSTSMIRELAAVRFSALTLNCSPV
jgi:hypothetical protein